MAAKRTQTVGTYEAKAKLSSFIADAERGIVTTITNRNRPVAKIVPASARVVYSKEEVRATLERFRALRRASAKGRTTAAALRRLVNEGRP